MIAHVAFFSCICLQRFGYPIDADTTASVSIFVLAGLTVWMLASGRIRFAAGPGTAFLLLAGWALLSAIAAAVAPDPTTGFSLFSLLEFLLLYGCLAARPVDGFDGAAVRRVFLFYVRLCAVCGIVEFALQFVGVKLFSFGQVLPALKPYLLEKGYAWNPTISFDSTLLRSNGFFLLEPSVFSQLLCIGALVDVLLERRWRWAPLYVAAYLTSFSGTGLLSLCVTLAVVGLVSPRYSGRVLGLALLAVVFGAVFAVLLPGPFTTFTNRFNEVGVQGSSGNARYLGPLAQLQALGGQTRGLLGYGAGATARSTYYTQGSGNAALQLVVDYGIVGLCLFFTFLVMCLKRAEFALGLLLVVIFELGGGYLLLAPYVLLMAALGVWGAARGTGSVAANRSRPPPGRVGDAAWPERRPERRPC